MERRASGVMPANLLLRSSRTQKPASSRIGPLPIEAVCLYRPIGNRSTTLPDHRGAAGLALVPY